MQCLCILLNWEVVSSSWPSCIMESKRDQADLELIRSHRLSIDNGIFVSITRRLFEIQQIIAWMRDTKYSCHRCHSIPIPRVKKLCSSASQYNTDCTPSMLDRRSARSLKLFSMFWSHKLGSWILEIVSKHLRRQTYSTLMQVRYW